MTPIPKGDNSATPELHDLIADYLFGKGDTKGRRIFAQSMADPTGIIHEKVSVNILELIGLIKHFNAPAHPETPAKDESGLIEYEAKQYVSKIMQNIPHGAELMPGSLIDAFIAGWHSLQQRTAAPDAEGVDEAIKFKEWCDKYECEECHRHQKTLSSKELYQIFKTD